MEKIIHQLEQSHDVLVVSHESPDGDAVGSLVAMALALGDIRKNVTLLNVSPIPAVYRFLPEVDRIVRTIEPEMLFDTVVVLDCADPNRVGEVKDRLDRIPAMINIDHHVTNSGFGHLSWVDTEACATAEIIYRLIKRMGIDFTRDMATAIYTGILTDTGSFRFANTNRASFSICDEMIAKGVDPYTVAQHVYGTYSLGRLKLLNLALDSIEISEDGKLSFMTLTRRMLEETGTQPEDIDGMINYAKRIQNVKVAVLIHEGPNGRAKDAGTARFYVSLRSDGSINVANLAAAYGGGGHHRAAGFSTRTTLPELKHAISRWVENSATELCN